jgi:hypothetical protein
MRLYDLTGRLARRLGLDILVHRYMDLGWSIFIQLALCGASPELRGPPSAPAAVNTRKAGTATAGGAPPSVKHAADPAEATRALREEADAEAVAMGKQWVDERLAGHHQERSIG